jgi:uroporphyrin-III C-methyltransferase/precorrin-2 dehydrogenase/sirohydrochlorin ferrochelatase/uroporphyrin-III C-methyltransferase
MSDTLHPVFIVGAGPGDPDLLTRKAERALRQADVVVYDRLVSDEILDLLPAGATRIFAGKAARDHHMPQEEINALLVKLAKDGKRVVRLKGGDPFVFGRGSEEAEELAKNDVPFEVVPGVTASMGCTSYAGIPLTHRGLATGVKIVTGHRKQGTDLDLHWESLADPASTLVIYMGLTNVELIAQKLIEHGLPADTPAAAIQNGTTPKQRTILTYLENLPACVDKAKLKAPTLLVIGQVVRLAKDLNWHHAVMECDDGTDG